MPQRKIELIENARARAAAYARRTKGLQKKASELATLCAVPVALICAPAGAGTPLVWESQAGVLDRYRGGAAVPRAWHTHRSYLEAELGKERAKLARARRRGALADWDAALNDMTLDETREVLETITPRCGPPAKGWRPWDCLQTAASMRRSRSRRVMMLLLPTTPRACRGSSGWRTWSTQAFRCRRRRATVGTTTAASSSNSCGTIVSRCRRGVAPNASAATTTWAPSLKRRRRWATGTMLIAAGLICKKSSYRALA
jgi:hypothetical protein